MPSKQSSVTEKLCSHMELHVSLCPTQITHVLLLVSSCHLQKEKSTWSTSWSSTRRKPTAAGSVTDALHSKPLTTLTWSSTESSCPTLRCRSKTVGSKQVQMLVTVLWASREMYNCIKKYFWNLARRRIHLIPLNMFTGGKVVTFACSSHWVLVTNHPCMWELKLLTCT